MNLFRAVHDLIAHVRGCTSSRCGRFLRRCGVCRKRRWSPLLYRGRA